MAARGFGYRSANCLNCGRASGGRTRCKACMAMTTAANKKRREAYRAAGKCPTCGQPTPHKTCDACFRKERAKKQKVRLDCITAYGGACACCGESRVEFLQIDHALQDGATERATAQSQGLPRTIYSRLKRQGYPVGYRVLCACCHFALSFYGYCPHNPLVTVPVRGRPTPVQ